MWDGTDLARERLIASVNERMVLQVVALCKALIADVADEPFVPRVNSHVTPERLVLQCDTESERGRTWHV